MTRVFGNGRSAFVVLAGVAITTLGGCQCGPATGDSTSPTVTVNQTSAQPDPTSGLPISFTVVFSEAIAPATFTTEDVTQGGTATGVTWSLSTTDNITWALQATAVTGPGTLVPSIAASAVTDPAGNNNDASTSTDNSVTYDSSGPSVTVNQAAGQADPTNSLPIGFTVVFSEAIDPSTFATADITQGGTALGVTWALSTSDNITWSLQATAVTGPGTIAPSIAGNTVTDAAGNTNTASTSTDNSVAYSTNGPTVTVNQAAAQADPTNALPITFTVVFSGAIAPATFTPADITQAGTATGVTWALSTTDNITWSLQATAVTGQGTLVPSIAASTVTDPAGNDNYDSSSTDSAVTYDLTAPTVTVEQAVGQADPTNGAPITFTVVFSEAIAPATFTPADITQGGTATGITWALSTTDNVTWTLQATAVTGQGTLMPSLAASTVTDPAGNSNGASTSGDNSVTYDASGPTVTVNQAAAQADPTNIVPITFTVVFSEPVDPSTFAAADITQGGTAMGVTWSLSTTDNTTWSLQATGVTGPGTIIPSIAASSVTDLAGNNNDASVSTDNSVAYSTNGPTVTVNQGSSQADPTNAVPITFTVVFSGAIAPATFTPADITQSGTATGITWALSTTDNIIWTLQATAVTGQGTVVPSITAAKVTDAAGNNNYDSGSADNSVAYDTTGPTVAVNQAAAQADPTNGVPVSFTVVFSEPIAPSTFTNADITQSGTATGVTWALSTTDNITWTLQATAVSGQGTLVPTIAASRVTDLAGNNNAVSTSTDNSVTYDSSGPTVTVNQAVAQVDPTNGPPISFKVVFSEAIAPTTFTAADITQSGTATGITWAVSSTDNITWTLEATAVSGAGTLVPSIAASSVTDLAGNDNAASTSIDNSVTYDSSSPSVTVNQAVAQVDPANALPIRFTVVFSEAIDAASFTNTDITQSGTATGVTWALSTTNNVTWTLQATAVSGQGTLVPSIAASRVRDLAGNGNDASTSADNSVSYDSTGPTVTVNQAVAQADATNVLPISFTVVFSEAITPSTFAAADITQSGTATGITWALSTADNITWTLQATAASGQGTLVPSIAASRVTDLAGNNNAASTSTDNSVKYDTTGPSVTVNQAAAQVDPTNALPIGFTVVFSEAIDAATFTNADITQSGTATGVTWAVSTADNITWTLQATAVSGQGTLVPSIAASSVTDPAGNNNAVSTSTDNSVRYDTTGPTVTVNQAPLQADPTNGGISFRVVFSEAIVPATFTSADITQSGTATGITWSLSTSDNITWQLLASAVLVEGTLVPTIAAGKVTDPAGNDNAASTSTDNSVRLDRTRPTVTVTQAVGQADPTNGLPIKFTVVFSETMATLPLDPFSTSDIAQLGTATGITWALSTTDNITWTLEATAVTGQGTVRPSIGANAVSDLAGNLNTSSSGGDNTVTYDLSGPTVTVNQAVGQAEFTNSVPISFTVVFSEAITPATFTPADITQNGTATGITWAVSTANNITWTLQATAVTGPGTLVPSIAAAKVTDVAGNNNAASTSTDNTVLYDTVASAPPTWSSVNKASSGSLLPSWNAPTDPSGIVSYTLYYDVDTGAPYANSVSGPATTQTLASLPDCQRLFLTVKATDGAGNVSDFSAEYVARTRCLGTGNMGGPTAYANFPMANSLQYGPLVTGDFNADNILDIAVTAHDANKIEVFLGTGSGGRGDGSFAASVSYATNTHPLALVTADFNADGILDLAATTLTNDTISVLLGNGSGGRGNGTFAARSDYTAGITSMDIVAADMNADGILDLVTADLDGRTVSVNLGNGSSGAGNGTFAAAVSYSVGVTACPVSLVVGDFNADDVLDVATGNQFNAFGRSCSAPRVAVLLGGGSGGRGNGTLGAPTLTDPSLPSISDVAAGDFDADGKLDLVVTGTTVGSANSSFLKGAGSSGPTGWFFPSSFVTPNLSTFNYALAPYDMNADGILDLNLSTGGGAVAQLGLALGSGFDGRGSGAFGTGVVSTLAAAGPAPYLGILAGDFDGNMIPDVVVPLRNSASPGLLAMRYGLGLSGEWDGTFSGTPRSISLGAPTEAFGLTVGDFNDDAIPDFAIALANTSKVGVFLGQGNNGQGHGSYSAIATYSAVTTGGQPLHLAAADVNDDAISDLVVADGVLGVVVYLGNGSSGRGNGTFASGVAYASGAGVAAFDLVLGDFDDNGIVDVAVSDFDTASVGVLLGNGTDGHGNGTFGAATSYAVGTQPTGLARGDFNEDGITDLAVTARGVSVLYTLFGQGSGGRGNGAFSVLNLNLVSTSPWRPVTGDFNRDGITDVAVFGSANVDVLLGNGSNGRGTGSFGSPTSYTVGTNPWDGAVGDFNRDGIADLVVLTTNGTNRGRILTGNGSNGVGLGTFTAQAPFPLGPAAGYVPGRLTVGDLDSDGIIDIVASDASASGQQAYVSFGQGTYQ